MTEIKNKFDKLTIASIWCIFLFSYVSVSASALSHILIVIPALYFSFIYIKNGSIKFSKSSIFLLLTVLFAIISVIFADDINNKLKQISKVKYMLFGVLAIIPYKRVIDSISRKHLTLMLNTFLVLLAIGNIAGIHALFSGHHILRMKDASDGVRAAGMYGMAITYGYGIELVAILCLGLLINFWKQLSIIVNRNILLISTITTMLGVYFSFTRGAVLALIISIPFIFIRKKKLFWSLLIGGICSLLLVLSIVWNGNDTGNRFLLAAKTTSNMIRVSQYQAAVAAFREKPLTGWGYRNFESNAYDIKKRNGIDYADFYGHAHNNYLEFLAATGLFGFLSFTLFVLTWLYEVWKRNDNFGLVVLPFVISFSISGLFQNTINDAENMFFIMFMYTLSQSLKNGTFDTSSQSGQESP